MSIPMFFASVMSALLLGLLLFWGGAETERWFGGATAQTLAQKCASEETLVSVAEMRNFSDEVKFRATWKDGKIISVECANAAPDAE